MINWTHNITFEELKNFISSAKNNFNIKYLVIDGIKSNIEGYKFKHTYELMSELGAIKSRIEAIDQVRYIYLIELTRV